MFAFSVLRLKNGFLSIAIAALGLLLPGSAYSQADPPASLPAPAMVGPLTTAIPRTLDAGPLGKLDVTGTLSGLGLWQGKPNPGDKAARADVSNGQIFLQKPVGFAQFFLQAGVYNIPALGTPSNSTRSTISNLYGPLPQAYFKLAPRRNYSFLIGKLPTLIGAEDTFTFENLNIERGLLWNQENAVNRGAQINYVKGRMNGALAWSDGYYSNRYNWISGALTGAINSANSIEVAAAGNLGHTDYSSTATPLYQNNSDIYNLIYTHTAKRWMLEPYFQYSLVTEDIRLGIARRTSTFGAAVLGNYTFSPRVSLAGRLEYIGSSGNASNGAVNLLYGPGSSAWSMTWTPTYQNKAFFARCDISFVQAFHAVSGDAFGPTGSNTVQVRGVVETGFMF